MTSRPRVGVVGEPTGKRPTDLADAVAERLELGGAQVFLVRLDGESEALPDDLAAGIDCCVVDAEAKSAAVDLLEDCLPPGAPLLTCCHSASATETAARCTDPGRVVGFALLGPVAGREKVECALALQSRPEAADAASDVWRLAGLEPVWVSDGAGLVMPRVVASLANEALFALAEGVADASDIDLAMRLGTRYPRGPLEWAAAVGLDQVLAIMDALAAEHGEDRYRAAPLLRRLVAAGQREAGEPAVGRRDAGQGEAGQVRSDQVEAGQVKAGRREAP